MVTAPLEHLRATLPELYQEARQAVMNPQPEEENFAHGRIEEMDAACGAGCIEIEGAGRLYITVKAGELHCTEEPIEGVPIRLAVRIADELAKQALELAPTLETDRNSALALSLLTSADVMKTCERFPLRGSFRVVDVPELGEVNAVVAMPGPEPPDEVKFSVTARYDDLEDVRDGELAARKFLMGGRLKFSGAYTPFLQLALELLKYLRI